ncbi:unnamed protein product [Symbiodinium sp. CCMP2592]|nr:unnamed protein product [Symbiodinium sp. CCMP2592]
MRRPGDGWRKLIQRSSGAEREELAKRKEAKHKQMLLRLEAVNELLRAEYANIVDREARVTFETEVKEILPSEKGPCVPGASSASSSSTEGCAKPSILKDSKQRNAGNCGRGNPGDDDSPRSSADSVYPDFDGDDDVFFEE